MRFSEISHCFTVKTVGAEIPSKAIVHCMEDLQFQPTELLQFCLTLKPNHDLFRSGLCVHPLLPCWVETAAVLKRYTRGTFPMVCVKLCMSHEHSSLLKELEIRSENMLCICSFSGKQ